MMKDNCKLALDIGGTSIKYGLVAQGQIVNSGEWPVDSTGTFSNVIDAFQSTVSDGCAMAQRKNLKISGIGISIPGPFDYQRGASLMQHKYKSLYDIPLREYFLAAAGAAVPVQFMSDSGAFLLGALEVFEMHENKVCCITIGTGIGFAAACDGQLLCGEGGGPLVRLFTMPYQDGCFEEYVSKRALENRYCAMGGERISVKEIAFRARCNEKTAKALFAQVGVDIIKMLTPIMKSHQFSSLLIGGQIAKACDLMLPAMQMEIKKQDYCFDLLPAGEITQAALLGAVKNLTEMGW